MNLNELYEPTPAGYRSEKDDNSVMKKDDTRKTRLTLAQLNKLRVMNDTRALEHEKKLEKVSDQYKAPAAAGAMPGV
jgi:hypothetical protein